MGNRGNGILIGEIGSRITAKITATRVMGSVTAFLLFCGLTASCPSIASAQSEARIEIRAGTVLKIPIHIEDFAYQGLAMIRFPGGEAPEEVLVADLEKADIFVVSRGRGATGNPPIALPAPQGTRAIVSATVGSRGGRAILTGNLRDATTGTRIFTREYPIPNPPDRRAMHPFSDDIVLYLTGERGIAQTRIAFIRDHGGSREIEIVDYDGENQAPLTHLRTIVISPAWSPSGDALAFTSFASGEAGVYGFRLADGKTWRISPASGMSSAPRWSPDGRSIAYARSTSGNTDIFIADAAGGNPTRLTMDPAIDTSPSFSPDGSRIVFTSDRSGTPQVYMMDRDGSNPHRLTFYGKESDSPDWSPRGDLIVFVSMFDDAYDLCVIQPDGGGFARLTAGEGAHENPHWAPDGRHLVFSQRTAGVRRIYVMASDGSGKRVLTDGNGDQYNPAWSPTRVVPSEQGAP